MIENNQHPTAVANQLFTSLVTFYHRLQALGNKITTAGQFTNFSYRIEKPFLTTLQDYFPHWEQKGKCFWVEPSQLWRPRFAESRCRFPWAGAADLNPPKGRVSGAVNWRNQSELFILMSELAGTTSPSLCLPLLCDCFSAPGLWIWQWEGSPSHRCYMISCSAVCGCVSRYVTGEKRFCSSKSRKHNCPPRDSGLGHYFMLTKKRHIFASWKVNWVQDTANNFQH